MHKFLAVLFVVFSFAFFAPAVQAKHTSSKAKSPSLSASLAKNKLSVSASFNNLKSVKSVRYQLTYDTDRGAQGAGGTIKTRNSSVESRKLLLGTCSRRVCTYHKGVRNIRLSADFTLKSGGVVSFEKNL